MSPQHVLPTTVLIRQRAALALATLAAAALLAAQPVGAAAPAAPVAASQVPVAPPASVQGLPDFTGLVETVGPAVVNIRTSEKVKAPLGLRLLPKGIAPDGDSDDDDAERRGIGSGFILSPDGYILTNAHVIEGADEVLVTLADKNAKQREFKAKVIGSDQRTDVAVVKIDATGLPFVKIGDVDKAKVGEWVIAIGSPYGLESTVTAGIISAKQRETGDYLQLLQTDVPINPGNSGGPLINMRGEVIGINEQILSPSGGSVGISLAVPINEAIRVADELRSTGKVVRGRIGVQISPVSRDVAELLGLGKPVGALVSSVQSDMPAEKAGIEAGDIITKVNGKIVEYSADLPRLVGEIRPGSKAQLQVFHNGKYEELTVSVIEFAADKPADGDTAPAAAASTKVLGLTVVDLKDAERAELHVKGGVKVDAVEGQGARAGLHEGDVILKVGNTPVSSVKEFSALVAKQDKARPIGLFVRRGDTSGYLLIKPSTK